MVAHCENDARYNRGRIDETRFDTTAEPPLCRARQPEEPLSILDAAAVVAALGGTAARHRQSQRLLRSRTGRHEKNAHCCSSMRSRPRFGPPEPRRGLIHATMGRPYVEEMARLPETFAWVAEIVKIEPLLQAIRTAGHLPLRAIGSGGSLTCAHALAGLHQRYTGYVATVTTPLEAVSEPLDAAFAAWLLSAGGGNVDVLAAARSLIRREPRQIGVLCGHDASPLATSWNLRCLW